MQETQQKEDLRTRRTKKFLCNALIELLEKKEIEKITIQEICDNAMIHRTTFYTHFEDKYALFEFLLKTIRQEIFSESILNRDYATIRELYLSLTEATLNFIEKNQQIMLKVIKNNTDRFANDLIFSTVEQAILDLLKENKSKTYFAPLPILSNFLAGGLISLITWWLYNPQKITKTEMLKSINEIVLKLEF